MHLQVFRVFESEVGDVRESLCGNEICRFSRFSRALRVVAVAPFSELPRLAWSLVSPKSVSVLALVVDERLEGNLPCYSLRNGEKNSEQLSSNRAGTISFIPGKLMTVARLRSTERTTPIQESSYKPEDRPVSEKWSWVIVAVKGGRTKQRGVNRCNAPPSPPPQNISSSNGKR
ncbi:hypothetical protein BKA81DRAFT_368434 [Phyllosticta paracitricarpa]